MWTHRAAQVLFLVVTVPQGGMLLAPLGAVLPLTVHGGPLSKDHSKGTAPKVTCGDMER